MQTSQFSLRTLLVLVAFAGIAITALMKPSVWWVVVLPGLLSGLLGFAASKIVVSSGRRRAFWVSLFVGTPLYFAAVVLLKHELHDLLGQERPDVWESYLGKPLWDRLHDPVIHNSRERRAFRIFVLCLHMIIAVVVSSVGASAAQYFIRHEDNESVDGRS